MHALVSSAAWMLLDLLARNFSGEVEALAQELKIKLYRTCVKDNTLVDDGTVCAHQPQRQLQGNRLLLSFVCFQYSCTWRKRS